MNKAYDIVVGDRTIQVLARARTDILNCAGRYANKILDIVPREGSFPNKLEFDACLPEEADLYLKQLQRA